MARAKQEYAIRRLKQPGYLRQKDARMVNVDRNRIGTDDTREPIP